jgi:hypothetical protein
MSRSTMRLRCVNPESTKDAKIKTLPVEAGFKRVRKTFQASASEATSEFNMAVCSSGPLNSNGKKER